MTPAPNPAGNPWAGVPVCPAGGRAGSRGRFRVEGAGALRSPAGGGRLTPTAPPAT